MIENNFGSIIISEPSDTFNTTERKFPSNRSASISSARGRKLTNLDENDPLNLINRAPLEIGNLNLYTLPIIIADSVILCLSILIFAINLISSTIYFSWNLHKHPEDNIKQRFGNLKCAFYIFTIAVIVVMKAASKKWPHFKDQKAFKGKTLFGLTIVAAFLSSFHYVTITIRDFSIFKSKTNTDENLVNEIVVHIALLLNTILAIFVYLEYVVHKLRINCAIWFLLLNKLTVYFIISNSASILVSQLLNSIDRNSTTAYSSPVIKYSNLVQYHLQVFTMVFCILLIYGLYRPARSLKLPIFMFPDDTASLPKSESISFVKTVRSNSFIVILSLIALLFSFLGTLFDKHISKKDENLTVIKEIFYMLEIVVLLVSLVLNVAVYHTLIGNMSRYQHGRKYKSLHFINWITQLGVMLDSGNKIWVMSCQSLKFVNVILIILYVINSIQIILQASLNNHIIRINMSQKIIHRIANRLLKMMTFLVAINIGFTIKNYISTTFAYENIFSVNPDMERTVYILLKIFSQPFTVLFRLVSVIIFVTFLTKIKCG